MALVMYCTVLLIRSYYALETRKRTGPYTLQFSIGIFEHETKSEYKSNMIMHFDAGVSICQHYGEST